VVNNNAGQSDQGLALLIKEGRVRKMICSFPRQSDSWHFDAKYKAGRDRTRARPAGQPGRTDPCRGAGIGGFFTPTGYGTMLAEGKETRIIDGRGQVFETPIHADVALIKALKADGKSETWSTARPPGTSAPSWPPPPSRPSCRSPRSCPPVRSTRKNIVTPGIYLNSIVRH
jgi:3-oxoadipate CoA-transferase alpha subunit